MAEAAEALEPHTEPRPLGPDSHTWEDFGSYRFHLMLPQAFVLQVAHPVIDAGVGEHSVYRTDPWGRARRSTALLWPIVYARPETAHRKGKELRELHRTIKGVDKHGKQYFALDPEAYGWVHVTAYDATIRMHEMFGRSPNHLERQAMFREWRQMGLMMGIRPEHLPATESDYWDYFDGMIRDRLQLSDVARDLLRDNHYLELPKPPGIRLSDRNWSRLLRVVGPLLRFNLHGTLPPRFREKVGLPWSRGQQWRFRLWCSLVRAIHAVTPRRWRFIPLARRAMDDARRHPGAYYWQEETGYES